MNTLLKKKCKVIKMPTASSTKIGIFADTHVMVANIGTRDIPRGHCFDLNICSYQPIWIDSWIMSPTGEIYKATIADADDLGMVVIASTNYNLNRSGVASIGDRFVGAYVREYNEGKEITEVMISYSDDNNLQMRDDEVIITRVKDTYSRAEIVDILTELKDSFILLENQVTHILNRLS